MPGGMMEEYVRRLHGRTVDEDLLLAGLLTKDSSDFNKDWTDLALTLDCIYLGTQLRA